MLSCTRSSYDTNVRTIPGAAGVESAINSYEKGNLSGSMLSAELTGSRQ